MQIEPKQPRSAARLLGKRLSAAAMAACVLVPVTASPQLPPVKEGSTPRAIAPIYNPDTKSYFELRVDLPKPPNWKTAQHFAATRVYKGVRGRLAVVKDVDTHSFLRANFHLNEEAWIGMRFICSVRKLVWVTGEEHELSAFKVWAPQWHRTHVTCRTNRLTYMPVYYLPSREGFRWQASGQQKYFVSYFVEYPTGKP